MCIVCVSEVGGGIAVVAASVPFLRSRIENAAFRFRKKMFYRETGRVMPDPAVPHADNLVPYSTYVVPAKKGS